MTETDSAISGGSVRDVLADTNNLSNVGKRLPAPSTTDRSRRPPTGDGPTARAGAGKMHSALNGARIPSAAVTS
ncbi:hypothetical protein GCM10023084_30310 [Streptomyces lacrimifluminis]|uniref:Uncharacterized protein n=1 Tax=Streptomyces lacrimifluminis TaxID=1500077 RepID=A0A917NTP4_9ACTN|nr:hypothetical protein GCM10012282_26930 [Streptomyces lacrimifluminis]